MINTATGPSHSLQYEFLCGSQSCSELGRRGFGSLDSLLLRALSLLLNSSRMILDATASGRTSAACLFMVIGCLASPPANF